MTIRTAAEAVVMRATALGIRGRTFTHDECQRLASALPVYPSWLLGLLATVPLCGLELGWQAFEPEPDFDGVLWIEMPDAKEILWESLEGYPGLGILPAGYVNFGGDSGGGGDPFFLSVHEGDDPPLYQVYHDVATDAATILADGRRLVAPRLSEFFQMALLPGETPR